MVSSARCRGEVYALSVPSKDYTGEAESETPKTAFSVDRSRDMNLRKSGSAGDGLTFFTNVMSGLKVCCEVATSLKLCLIASVLMPLVPFMIVEKALFHPGSLPVRNQLDL